jgi:predicted enzyme related to lactoylglutathione lyase
MASRIVHFEIHADDPARAAKFYSSIFGWDIKKWDVPGSAPMEYWVVTTGPKEKPGINGGLLRRKGSAPKGGEPVNAYVCTAEFDDLDATMKQVEAAGGKIALPKMAVPGMAWLAYGIDTEGNIFGMIQNDKEAK